jgi:hypothetical protein
MIERDRSPPLTNPIHRNEAIPEGALFRSRQPVP